MAMGELTQRARRQQAACAACAPVVTAPDPNAARGRTDRHGEHTGRES